MRSALVYFLLLLSLSSLAVARTNFTQCLEDFRKDPNATGGVDYKGYPTTPAQADGITYKTCKARCGSGSESFNWRNFTQSFATWLLPWLALISQLPFGSGNYPDDFVSIAMSVGSPALAAYSLALTSLNARSVYRRAKRCKHECKFGVARALISLQQTPLELTKENRLLNFISVNFHWWQEIGDRLGRNNAWSIAAGTSVAWVFVAFVFTLVDSFISLDYTGRKPSEGQAVGTLWLWSLCLVIGWLWVPTFTNGELKRAIGHANRQAAKKAVKKLERKATDTTEEPTTTSPRRVSIAKESVRQSIEEGVEEREKEGTGSVREVIRDAEEINSKPNAGSLRPPHRRSTISFRADPEGERSRTLPGVGMNREADQSVSTLVPSIAQSATWLEGNSLFISKDLSALHRDELRPSPTFNYSRVMRYLVLADDVLETLERVIHEKEGGQRQSPGLGAIPSPNNPTFPPGALISMFGAFIAALILQFGTGATATIIVIFTPTIGLGCRSLGYVIYGTMSIIILVLTVTSTVFARISETRKEGSPRFKDYTAYVAIALRKICLLLATVNMTGLVLLSCLQLSNVLDNCYCNSSVVGRGRDSYIVISYSGWVSMVRTIRAVAIAIAGVSMFIYMGFLWIVSPPSEDVSDS